MVKAARVVASAAVIVYSAWLGYRLCVVPYRCNLEEKRIEGLTVESMQSSGASSVVRARQNLEELDSRTSCADQNIFMIRAANLRTLGRIDESIVMYKSALAEEKRPEVYFQLGMAEFAAGQRNAAVDSFVQTLLFQPSLEMEVPAELRSEVRGKVESERALRAASSPKMRTDI
ncbi:MAG: hypothetical protein ABI718_00210 [Acidobacteriota bacterium]